MQTFGRSGEKKCRKKKKGHCRQEGKSDTDPSQKDTKETKAEVNKSHQSIR
ncbi:hypothetical protein GCM10007921_27260 [Tritonibacter mobilis]|nr:hypothetical protein GCM10007921_27260 [Tritonibacter mobilis]